MKHPKGTTHIIIERKERVETGALAFNDDWPGVFIRGDNAAYFLQSVHGAITRLSQDDTVGDAILNMALEELRDLLASCRVNHDDDKDSK